ncbi:MAG: GNAT family protein [Phycisphaerales bacterium]
MSELMERFKALPGRDWGETLRWRAGSLRDYAALAQFHYLRNKPATATRVIVVEHVEPSIGQRFRAISDFGFRISDWAEERSAAEGVASIRNPQSEIRNRIVGVLVESLPALSCRLRDLATDGRYGGWKDRRMAARLLNSEVRCISRVVVHPQWRGLGLAVKLVRRALETMTTPYTEALAAMGRVHPFFRLAGMAEYHRPALKDRRRLLEALRYCGVEPWELASEERMARVMGMEGESGSAKPQGALLRRELARWAGRRLTLTEQLEKAREELLCEVVYYGKRNDQTPMTNDQINANDQ